MPIGANAVPGPGTRTVTDTESKLSITGGQLSFAGGKATPAWGDPGLWYGAVTRTAGRMLLLTWITDPADKSYSFGLSHLQAGATSKVGITFVDTATAIRAIDAGTGPIITTVVGSTAYQLCIVLCASGAFYCIKGGNFTNWTLLWRAMSDSTGTLYPAIVNKSAAFTADNIRIPTRLWLPTPLAYTAFGTAQADMNGTSTDTTGADGQACTARTWVSSAGVWVISSGTAKGTPGVGSELFVNGGFDTDTDWMKGAGWTISGGVGVGTNADGVVYQNVLTSGVWYQLVFDLVSRTGGSVQAYLHALTGPSYTTIATHTMTGRAVGASGGIDGNGFSGTLDNVSIKALTLANLFASITDSTTTDVLASVNITRTAGTQAGLVTNLDSAATPANFLLAYLDGAGNAKLDKCVAGTYTNLISAAVTYSAGATLRLIVYTSGASLKANLYYANVLVGTEQTISDAGIISNTIHGLFSTYSANLFDNFDVQYRGKNNEFSALDSF